jgi:molybdopterin-guanine dinucleotide biosynthesis protein A
VTVPLDAAALVLAGGRATRFPDKLESVIDGEPMLLRVCRNAGSTGLPLYVAGGGPFAEAIATRLGAVQLPDRWPGAGPLRALLSAFDALACEWVFVLAGDEPRAGQRLLRTLGGYCDAQLEAIVPEHDGRIEPLAALYRRQAALREARSLAGRGDESMHALIARLNCRFAAVDGAQFVNVNTPADLRAAASAGP